MERRVDASLRKGFADRSESRDGLHTIVLSDVHLADAEMPPPDKSVGDYIGYHVRTTEFPETQGAKSAGVTGCNY